MDCNSIINKFGQKVIGLRKEKSVTQQELADGIGATSEYIRQLEAGHIDVDLVTVAFIAKHFNMTISEMYAGLD